MNTIRFLFLVVAACSFFAGASPVFGQGTAFTYQGRLDANGSPANGSFNLLFSLYATSNGGSPVAPVVTNNGVAVTNGLFTATVDFGSNVFNGAANWLEIAVATNGGGFTTLAPRQQLTPAPYAIYAEGASAAGISGTLPAANLGGTYGNAVSFTNGANNFSGSTFTGGDFIGSGTNLTGVAKLAGNNAMSGSNTFSGGLSIVGPATLAGNAQGGAVTNLDKNVQNVADYGYNLDAAMTALTNGSSGQGGVLYIPTNNNSTVVGPSPATEIHYTGFPNVPSTAGNTGAGSALKIRGNSSQLSQIVFSIFAGSNATNGFDSWNAPINGATIDFEDVSIVGNSGNNYGYVSGPLAGGRMQWDDVAWYGWTNADFVTSGFGGTLDNQFCVADSGHPTWIGGVLAPLSDGTYLHVLANNMTWAVVEANSRADAIRFSVQGNTQIGCLLGGGGPYELWGIAETIGNALVSEGYPTNWPNAKIWPGGNTQYAGYQSGNNAYIGPVDFHNLYMNGVGSNFNPTNDHDYANGAIVKIFSASAFGLGGGTLRDITSAGRPGIISYSAAGDASKWSFRDVYLGGTNAWSSSQSNTIPDPNGDNVNINKAERDYSGSTGVMTFSRDINGNVFANGVYSCAETLTPTGATGNQTINKPSGTVRMAGSGTSVTVTDSLVTANSIVLATVETNDPTAYVKNVVHSAGSFTINLGAAATAEVPIGFVVINQ